MAQQLNIRNHSRDSAGLRYVYPVISRRAGGVSVGINLNPNNACNWRCIYCQVPNLKRGSAPPIDIKLLETELRGFLVELIDGDFMRKHVPEGARRIMDVAISGNGEPTSAEEFPAVVELAGQILQEFELAPQVKLRCITNGSLVSRDTVQRGLRSIAAQGGEVWFKVDAATPEAIARINGVNLSVEQVARNLERCAELCPTWVQTCMFKLDGEGPVAAEIAAYLALLGKVGAQKLQGVLLYSLARPSLQAEASRLSPLPQAELEAIAARIAALGLAVRISP